MSASMLRAFSEFEHGHFGDFFVAKCLVGDICKNIHKAQKDKYENTKTRTQTWLVPS